jgi:hypothetical protein
MSNLSGIRFFRVSGGGVQLLWVTICNAGLRLTQAGTYQHDVENPDVLKRELWRMSQIGPYGVAFQA